MKTLVLASVIVLGTAGVPVFAQSTTAPAGTPAETTAPVTTAPAPAAEREATRPATQTTTGQGDPNSTGPDKVNGMEVPAMKGETGTGR